jgi:ATP-dependent Clp protease ATP-binding subunit ClpB
VAANRLQEYFDSNSEQKGLVMRLDRLTTKFQEALSDAQSMAVGKDNPTIEPAHVLLAMVRQTEGGVRGVVSKAGGNMNTLKKALELEVEQCQWSSTGGQQVASHS